MRTPGLILPLVALASMFARPAAADEPEVLAPGDYYRADPIPVAPAKGLSPEPGEPEAAVAATLFVNFDGAQLSAGNDHAPTNKTAMPSQYAQYAYPAYGGGSKRAAALQAAIKDWAPFNVLVTDKRPASGDYTMCMTGPGKGGGLPNGVLGIAPLDCQADPNHVVYAFHSEGDQFSASTQATTISQEIAHAFGLEHVTQESDIMNPYNAGGDPSFLDQCYAVDGGGNGILCGSNHAKYCGQSNQQNSYQELLGLFGPSAPDTMAPTVNILTPKDGDVFQAGDSFSIDVSAVDEKQEIKVELFNNGALAGTDAESPYSFPAQNVPAGAYAFHAIAHDGAGNQGMSATVHVTVMEPGGSTSGTSTGTGDPTSGGPDSGTTGSGTSDSGSGTGGSTTDDGATSGGVDASGDDPSAGADDATASSALPPGYGDDFDQDGFCSIGGGPAPLSPVSLGLGLLLLPLLRRRR